MRQLSLERSANLSDSKAIITTQHTDAETRCDGLATRDRLARFEKKKGWRAVFGKNCLGR